MSNVPTFHEIDYALRALQDALHSVKTGQELNETGKQEQVRLGNFTAGGIHSAMHIGLMTAETCIMIEIDTLKQRRNAVEAYMQSQA